MGPVAAFALVGVLGVGSQWLAWRLRLPAIVLMLAAGILVGPVLGFFEPARDIGTLTGPLISLAVAVILFEGGLTLDLHGLRDARAGVWRLVFAGAPIGWLLSVLTLRYGAGLGWESATVFGGIMVVTGPTVIAPLLRQARLARRPAQLLQWEAIVNDPIGALAAVLAFEVVVALRGAETVGTALWGVGLGVALSVAIGLAAGFGIAWAFWRNRVPEFMKVPVLFVTLLATFALADGVLHESGLLAVTVMGLVIANSDLPSFVELRRFKEHATILLVSGVFILLAASLDFAMLKGLSWRTLVFVLAVVLVARPLTVLLALLGTGLPRAERLLIALTGPRGVVLVAVAGLFGERLAAEGVADADLIAPLAFALVTFTVILHGFTFAPLARLLGLSAAEAPGVLLVGGSRFTVALAEVLKKAGVEVLISDPNHAHLIRARAGGLRTFYGDILSEAAEHQVELLSYETLLAATDNDAYNTLVATDFAPEFGRDRVWQVGRAKADKSRHALPTQLGGRPFGRGRTHDELDALMADGWRFRATRLSEEFTIADWRARRPEAIVFATIGPRGTLKFHGGEKDPEIGAGARVIALLPPGAGAEEPPAQD
ncbi:MAG: cation:proton antiporter [Defluviimonas sp.]